MLTREQIAQYLAEMDTELAEAGLTGEIVLCGGAVMAYVYEARPSTKDVDALFEPRGSRPPSPLPARARRLTRGGCSC